MTETKHTPRPWVFIEGDDFDNNEITSKERIDTNITPICRIEIEFTGKIGEEQKANANLIKTAPEMLEALKLQHEAIDILFAMVINLTPRTQESFHPTKSGTPWEALLKGNDAINKAEGKKS